MAHAVLAMPGSCVCGEPADVPFAPLGITTGFTCAAHALESAAKMQQNAGNVAGALAGMLAQAFGAKGQTVREVRKLVQELAPVAMGAMQTSATAQVQPGGLSPQEYRRALAGAVRQVGVPAPREAEEVDVTPRKQ